MPDLVDSSLVAQYAPQGPDPTIVSKYVTSQADPEIVNQYAKGQASTERPETYQGVSSLSRIRQAWRPNPDLGPLRRFGSAALHSAGEAIQGPSDVIPTDPVTHMPIRAASTPSIWTTIKNWGKSLGTPEGLGSAVGGLAAPLPGGEGEAAPVKGTEADALRNLTDAELAAAHPLGSTPVAGESAGAGMESQAAKAVRSMLGRGEPPVPPTSAGAAPPTAPPPTGGPTVLKAVPPIQPELQAGKMPTYTALPAKVPATPGLGPGFVPGHMTPALEATLHEAGPGPIGDDVIRRAQAIHGVKVSRGYDAEEAQVQAALTDPQALLAAQHPSPAGIKAMQRMASALTQKGHDLTQAMEDAFTRGDLDTGAKLRDEAVYHKDLAAQFGNRYMKSVGGMARWFNYMKADFAPEASLDHWAAEAELQKGAALTDAETAQLAKHFAENNIPAMTKYIEGLTQYSKAGVGREFWRLGLISGPPTLLRIATTPTMQLFDDIAGSPFRAFANTMLNRVSHLDVPTFATPALRAEALRAAGIQAGRSVQQIWRGETPSVGGTAFGMGYGEKPFLVQSPLIKSIPVVGPAAEAAGKLVQAARDLVVRSHGTAHYSTTFPYVYQSELWIRSYQLAKLEGLSGAKLVARARELALRPSLESQTWAAQRAMESSLINSNLPSRMVGAARRMAQITPGPAGEAAETGLTAAVPFSKISFNIINRAAEHTPLGFGYAAMDVNRLLKAIKANAPKDALLDFQTRAAIRFGRAGAGTAGLFTTGYLARKAGFAVGSKPQNPTDQARWDRLGISPYAFSFTPDKPGSWHSPLWWGPVGLAFAMGSGTADQGLLGAIPAAAHESFLRGVKDISDLVSGDKQAFKGAERSEVQSAVPFSSAVRTVQRATDRYERKPRNLKEDIEAVIPGLSKNVPKKFGKNGLPLTHDTGLGALSPENFPREEH